MEKFIIRVSGLWQYTTEEFYKRTSLPKFTIYLSEIKALRADKEFYLEQIIGNRVTTTSIEEFLNVTVHNSDW